MENLICPGFMASGVVSGLKKAGEKDLAIIFSKIPAKVAGVFTSNKIKAAPEGKCRKMGSKADLIII